MAFEITDPAIIQRLLEAATVHIEHAARDRKLNLFEVRAVADAATHLGFPELEERAFAIFRQAPDEAFWAGAITNIELPTSVPDAMRARTTPEALARNHPPIDGAKLLRMIESSEEHIALCSVKRFDEAQAVAKTDLALEEVGLTLAVLGEFEAAIQVASSAKLPDFRKQGIKLVLLIEYHRRGKFAEAQSILTEYEAQGIGASTLVHLAYGIAGYDAWPGYPYPDW